MDYSRIRSVAVVIEDDLGVIDSRTYTEAGEFVDKLVARDPRVLGNAKSELVIHVLSI